MALKIQAKNKTAEIWLYGDIGDSWGDSISAKQFADELKKAGQVSTILLHINSPGGSVFDGLTMYNLLRSHPAHVDTEIDGMALSIASIVALSGDTVKMAGNAFFMIHNPWTLAYGEAKDFREMADRLDLVRDNLLSTYFAKTSQNASREQITSWMDAETWFNAADAQKHGFIDEIFNALDVAAKYDLSRYGFKNAPSEAKERFEMPQDLAIRARLARMNMIVQRNSLNARHSKAQA